MTSSAHIPVGDIEPHIVIALPDFPIAHAYVRWLQTQPSADAVGAVVHNKEDFLSAYGPRGMQDVLGSLLRGQRPPPLWCTVWSRKQSKG